MSYIGKTPTSVPLTSSDITDSIISLPKLTDGTDGNLISYDASGNPVAVATGTDGQVLTSTGAGSPPVFEDAAGGTNTPAFYAYDTSGQSLPNAATTKLNYATEVYDTDSAFASSRFTVPSGKDGKYHFTAMVGIQQASEVTELTIYIYKNGSSEFAGDGQNPNYPYAFASGTLDLAVGDYVEAYCEHHYGSAVTRQTSKISNYFQAFKLIE